MILVYRHSSAPFFCIMRCFVFSLPFGSRSANSLYVHVFAVFCLVMSYLLDFHFFLCMVCACVYVFVLVPSAVHVYPYIEFHIFMFVCVPACAPCFLSTDASFSLFKLDLFQFDGSVFVFSIFRIMLQFSFSAFFPSHSLLFCCWCVIYSPPEKNSDIIMSARKMRMLCRLCIYDCIHRVFHNKYCIYFICYMHNVWHCHVIWASYALVEPY